MTQRFIVSYLFVVLFATPAIAADELQSPPELPKQALVTVLDTVSKKTGDVFLIDHRVYPHVVLGQAEARRLSYATLLVVLRNNALAAVRSEGLVSIINVAAVRQHGLPVIADLDDSIHSEEWVTMTVRVNNAHAPGLVPILRPILPQPGHLVAHAESNTVIIVARYANLARVVRLIRELDANSTQQ